MRLVRTRPERLVIEHRPASLMSFLAFLAVLALAAGAAMAIAGNGCWAALPLLAGLALALLVHFDFPAHARITLDRARGTAEILWIDGAGITRRILPLTEVNGAVVQTIRSHEGPALRRAALHTETGEAQLTRAFLDSPAPERIVRAVNAWIAR